MHDSNLEHRHSIRLKGYDYSQEGVYFITICVHEHLHLFGNIVDMIGAFKSLTTNDYIYNVKNNHWKPFNSTLWQRNYYEHIIRDEKSYNNISEYIVNNPLNWKDDTFYEETIHSNT
jgi:hypothetical protein